MFLLYFSRIVSDITCFLGVLGIILMITANEITFSQINHKDTKFSWFMKLAISISTIILIGFVLKYHLLDAHLYSVNNSIDDWRITLTDTKIVLIFLEVLICAVHPIPRTYPRYSNVTLHHYNTNSTKFTQHSLSYISLDVALGLPSK